jgi:uncharacterized glyoxalase superfamily protein PhnB
MGDRPRIGGIVPYVFCNQAGTIAEWCVQVLGFEERHRWLAEDVVRNVDLIAGDSEVWLDGDPSWRLPAGAPAPWVGFWVDDVDAMYDSIRVRVPDVPPPVDRDFGIRMVTVTDPEGHEWAFMRRTV